MRFYAWVPLGWMSSGAGTALEGSEKARPFRPHVKMRGRQEPSCDELTQSVRYPSLINGFFGAGSASVLKKGCPQRRAASVAFLGRREVPKTVSECFVSLKFPIANSVWLVRI